MPRIYVLNNSQSILYSFALATSCSPTHSTQSLTFSHPTTPVQMTGPLPSPTTSERTHKLKAYLHRLHLPHRSPSTSTATTSAPTSQSRTRTPSPMIPRPKGDDSILASRNKLKLTGDAKLGSHSACWGLTPDGQMHEPQYVDASELCGAVDFQDEPEKRKVADKTGL
jgi:hypothetical protein